MLILPRTQQTLTVGNGRRYSSKGRQGQTPILLLTQGVLTPPLGISGQPHCIAILLILRPVIASSTKHTPGKSTCMSGLTVPMDNLKFRRIQYSELKSLAWQPHSPAHISNLCSAPPLWDTELSQLLLYSSQGQGPGSHPELMRMS